MTNDQRERPLPAIPQPLPQVPSVTNYYAPRDVVYHSISDSELDTITSVTPTDFGFFTLCLSTAIAAAFVLISALRASPSDLVIIAVSAPCVAVFVVLTAVFFVRWRAADKSRTMAIARVRRSQGRQPN
jgi:hypothetical protein